MAADVQVALKIFGNAPEPITNEITRRNHQSSIINHKYLECPD
jgi:hypothetical protein